MKYKQVKFGAILSYFLIIINTLYALIVTPFILDILGETEYGIYKTISSLSSALMVLDLGIGGTIMRYLAKYKANKEEDKIPNFLAMMFFIVGILMILVGIMGGIVYFSLNRIYSNTFTNLEIQKAKQIFLLFLINMMIHVFENGINGIITGNNKFIFGNGLKLIRIIARAILLGLLLPIFSNSLVLIIIDLGLTIVLICIEVVYLFFGLKIKIKFEKWDKKLFIESGKYTLLMFLTTIAAQVNNNIDNVIIGAISGPALVSIYSMGLMLFSMYEQLSTSISSVMLPTISNQLAQNDNEAVKKTIIKAGQIQFILLGAAIVGFTIVGKDFIYLWLGEGYQDVYIISLLLMIPALFELIVNVCLSVLRAKNKLGFRTTVLFLSTIINFAITFVLVKYVSYIAAAIGTAFSFIVGSVIIMNIYYYKTLNFNMIKIYFKIISKVFPCLAVSGIALLISSHFLSGTWCDFLLNVMIFIIFYVISLWFMYLSKSERKHFLNKFRRK